MLTPTEAQDRAQSLVDMARTVGADAADAIYVRDASTQVQMRLGALEDVERSEGEELGLRVFVGARSASVSTSDLEKRGLSDLVERAVAMAREAPEDAFAGLAPRELFATGPLAKIDSDDRVEPDPQALRDLALLVEDAARAVPGVTNSEGGGASAGRTTVALATSHGFAGAYSTSGYSLSASVVAGTGDAKERDYAFHSVRHFEDLESAQTIGERAGSRAVARLNPVAFAGGAMPVMFDPRVGSSLLGHFIGAISGPSIARGTSFLLDALDTQVFAKGIDVIDCPHRRRGLRSKAFDGEGLPTAKTVLVDDGRLTQWILESASARQLELAPTGHATRGVGGAPGVNVTNLHLGNGDVSRGALMADIKNGVYVTELIGQGVNPVTGDYSRGAGGFRIVDGELGPPVSEITIAGNLKDIYASLIAADDLDYRRAINVPTLRTDAMTVATGSAA